MAEGVTLVAKDSWPNWTCASWRRVLGGKRGMLDVTNPIGWIRRQMEPEMLIPATDEASTHAP